MSTTTFTELLSEREMTLPEPPARLAATALPLPARHKARTGRRAGRRAARRVRLDWEAMAVILLMLVCAAVCVYRLCWAVQL